MVFYRGDLVSAPLHILLEGYMNLIGMQAYKARPEIYGVVRDTSTLYGCDVSWSMERMFNLEMDELNVDYENIGISHLTLVRSKDDSESGGDPYTDTFFRHNFDGWIERVWMPQRCTFCNGEPRATFPPHVYSCRRMMFRTQMAMMQLYFDLGSVQNASMTNKQKRFQCYRFYVGIVHGALGQGNRRRVDACVEREIVSHFPNPADEERVGFQAV